MTSPTLSIVIPVYNDPDGVKATLRSLTDQTHPIDEYEILVVDNGSTDQTPSVIAAFEQDHPTLVTGVTETAIQSSYAARNRGIAHAIGTYVAFVDADMRADSDWVEVVITRLHDKLCRYLACNVRVFLPKRNRMARFDQLKGFPIEAFLRDHQFAPTCSLVVETSLFGEIGTFDSRLMSGGDCEFGKRVAEAGITQVYAPDIVLFHPARTTVSAHLTRHWRIGRGITQQLQYHPNRVQDRYPSLYKTFVPPRPQKLRSFARKTELTVGDGVVFYGLEYAEQLTRGLGRVYEHVVSSAR